MQCEVSSTMTPSRHLATTLGLSTDRLQVMKASFFSDQENVPRLGGHAHSGTASYFDKGPAHFNSKSRLALKPLSAPKSHLIPPSPPRVVRPPLSRGFSHFPVDTSPVLSSLSEAPPTRTIYLPSEAPPIAPPTSLSVTRQKVDRLVTLDESVLNGRTRFHRDAGAFLGRSFRVGWGRGWTLAHVGHPISDSGEEVSPIVPHSLFPVTVGGHTPSHSHSSGYSYSIVSIEKVDASPWMKEGLLDTPTDLEVRKICVLNFLYVIKYLNLILNFVGRLNFSLANFAILLCHNCQCPSLPFSLSLSLSPLYLSFSLSRVCMSRFLESSLLTLV